MSELITSTTEGLYCEAGDFHVDPWRPVPRAVITHSHADHARPGHGKYLTVREGQHVLRARVGSTAVIDTLDYGEPLHINGVRVSLHPAGHILGSAQVRIEHGGEVCVVSGDYRLTPDGTCRPFEAVNAHLFVTECTFGLPIYRWEPPAEILQDLNSWWRRNRDEGRVSLVFAYALGKAQRVIAGIDSTIAPIYCHGAVERVNCAYRRSGVALPTTIHAPLGDVKQDWQGALVIAPPSAMGSGWLRKFRQAATGYVSGWMRLRGARRRRSVDRGFALSDHADWTGLLEAIQATGAQRVLATHGQTGPLVRYLQEQGLDAAALQTEYIGERDDVEIDAATDELEEAETDLPDGARS